MADGILLNQGILTAQVFPNILAVKAGAASDVIGGQPLASQEKNGEVISHG
jgi:hypothetical protein